MRSKPLGHTNRHEDRVRRVTSTSRRTKLVVTTLVALGLLSIAHPASASWLSWTGAAVAFVALVVVIFAAPIAAAVGVAAATVVTVAAVAAAVAATLIVADIGLTIAGQMAAVPPINRPAVATGPEPPSAPIQSAISSSYQGLPLPGNEADAFVTASNDVIGALNVIDDDILMGQPGGVVDDFLAFTDTLGPVADEYQNIFGAQEPFIPQLNLSQPDIDALQADIAQSGLPPEFVTTLLDAGFSPSTIQGFTTFIGSTEINLGVPTVTGSQIFDAAADITFVPEPASLLLLGTGVGLLGVRRRKRPRPALQSINSDARTC